MSYLKVVTRRAGPQADAAVRQADLVREVRGAPAGVGVVAGLARQLAQRAPVHDRRHAVTDLRGRR